VNIAGGVLGGSGYIADPVMVGTAGTLAPGATLIGTAGIVLTIGNNVFLNNDSTLVINIDATSNATDLLSITNGGDLTLAGNDTLTVDLVNGTQLTQPSYVFAILTGGGTINGTFSNLNIPSDYAVDYGAEVPGELQLVAIPEPATWATLLAGLGTLSLVKRLRRSRKAQAEE
jgi:hypothetical protein